MTHPRKEIRDAAVAAVTGLATTGSNVFASQIYPLADSQLPALRVYTRGDRFGAMEREYTGAGTDWGKYARTVLLTVEAVVKTSSGYDTTLDAICELVENALEVKAAWTSVSGDAVQVSYVGTEIAFSADADRKQAMAMMNYEVGHFEQ